jgi:hypothetical protein
MRLAHLAPVLALTLANTAHAAGYLPCFYNSRSEGFAEHADCARPLGDSFVIRKRHLARMLFDRDRLSGMLIGSQFFYVKPDGRMLPVLACDNGPDYFVEGLTRAQINGKIGYYDKHFRQVIAPRYDWGFPFENGRAQVCNGCKQSPSGIEGRYTVLGGVWGTIDKRGNEVVPLK